MKEINSLSIKIIKALINKNLEFIIEYYEKLDSRINNKIKNKIISKISKSTNEEIIYFLVSYFDQFNIDYGQRVQEEEEPISRKTEKKENITRRQKAFIQRKKSSGEKKMQFYISAEAHKKLKSLKEQNNLTYSKMIEELILKAEPLANSIPTK